MRIPTIQATCSIFFSIADFDGDDSSCRDDHYESIYEVIQHPSDSESDFDEVYEVSASKNSGSGSGLPIPGLTKFAEAAGKRMRKLRRTWSLKKSDISRNLKKYSVPGTRRPIFSVASGSDGSNQLRRKPSVSRVRKAVSMPAPVDAKSVIRHHGGPVVGGNSKDETTFYITLTIERDEDEDYDEEDDSGLYANKSTSHDCSTSTGLSNYSITSLSNDMDTVSQSTSKFA